MMVACCATAIKAGWAAAGVIKAQRYSHLFAAVAVLCLAPVLFVFPASAGALTPDTEAAIRAENAKWARAYARGDYAAISRLYTADGELLPPGGNRISGGKAIVSFFVRANKGRPPGHVSFSNAEFYGSDSIVAEVSDTAICSRDGELKYRGKQTLIFLKSGGQWQLHRDIWNQTGP